MAKRTDSGADQEYLRSVQYRDGRKLGARRALHEAYGRNDLQRWLAGLCAWPRGGPVLEVGCGAGWFWEAAAEVAPADLSITLTDLSEGMVAETLARVRGLGRWATVEGRAADAQALPFPDASFDLVLAFHMLYHLPDPARGVAELARVLRPGGQALIATNGPGHLAELTAVSREVFGDSVWDALHARFSLANGGALLEPAFARVELRPHPDRMLCTDPAIVVDYLTSYPPGEDATPDQLARLRAAVEAAIARGGGAMTVTSEPGVFDCRR